MFYDYFFEVLHLIFFPKYTKVREMGNIINSYCESFINHFTLFIELT